MIDDVRSTEIDRRGASPGQSEGHRDAVEAALADALTEAARAGRFDVVAQLAKELEARRLARAENVIALDARRARG